MGSANVKNGKSVFLVILIHSLYCHYFVVIRNVFYFKRLQHVIKGNQKNTQKKKFELKIKNSQEKYIILDIL